MATPFSRQYPIGTRQKSLLTGTDLNQQAGSNLMDGLNGMDNGSLKRLPTSNYQNPTNIFNGNSMFDSTGYGSKMEPIQQDKINPFFAMRGATNVASYLSGVTERGRQNQYMYDQYSTMGQMPGQNIQDFQPVNNNPYFDMGGILGKVIMNPNMRYHMAEGGSISDYAKASGRDASFSGRKTLAEQLGISGYRGTSDQNIKLLTMLRDQDSQSKYVPGDEDNSAHDEDDNMKNQRMQSIQNKYAQYQKSGKMVQEDTDLYKDSPRVPEKVTSIHTPYSDQPGRRTEDAPQKPAAQPSYTPYFNQPGRRTDEDNNAKPVARQNIPQATAPVKQHLQGFQNPIMNLDDYDNYGDQRHLQSGVITDKGTNTNHIIENGKVTHSFPILTGKNPNRNDNVGNMKENGTDPMSTPVGSYMLQPNANIYGQPGFDMNPIPAFGQGAPRAKNLAQHVTYDPTERNKYYNMSPEERYISYGCVNGQCPDISSMVSKFPKGDTAIVINSKNQNDKRFLQRFSGKRIGGYMEGGGEMLPMITPQLDPMRSSFAQRQIAQHTAYHDQLLQRIQAQQGKATAPTTNDFLKEGGMSPNDARQILHDGTAHGQPLTDKQRRMFGAMSKGNTLKFAGGGKIEIKPENKGKFTTYKERTGKTTEEALHSKDPHVRQMANFARNAKKWKN